MFVFAADLHMRDLTFQSCPTATGDSVRSLGYLLELAHSLSTPEHAVPLVLGGDVWDSTRVTPNTLSLALQEVRRFSDIPIYFINGNHDSCTPSWTDFLNGIHMTADPVTLPDGERLIGMDYRNMSKIRDFMDSLEYTPEDYDFLISHQFVEAGENEQIASSIPLSIFSKVKTVLAGDIHSELCVRNATTELYYPGPTNRRTITEPSGSCMVILKPEEETRLRSVLALCVLEPVNNGFCFTRVPLAHRELLCVEFDRELVSEGLRGYLEQFLLPQVERSANTAGMPLVVFYAPAFEESALKIIRELSIDLYCPIFRKKGGINSLELSINLEGTAASSMTYAVDALVQSGQPREIIELGKEVLLDEDNFFEDLNRKFS